MTSRERVRKAVSFKGPDMLPVDYWVLPAAYIKYGKDLHQLLADYPKDFADPWPVREGDPPPTNYRKGTYTDPFGCVWRLEHDGILGQIVECPVKDAASLEAYEFPSPDALEGDVFIRDLQAAAQNLDGGKYFAADFIRTFERMHFLRGMEGVLMDMAVGDRAFFMLLDKVAEWNLAHLEMLLHALGDSPDAVWFSDDWGTQNSLLIKPDSWRKYFKPYYKEMFERVKSSGKKVFFHSDGNITDIIGDMIDIGVDAMNCQVALMGPKKLSRRFGGKVTFHTDMDRQNVLPFGSAKDVVNHVFDVAEKLGQPTGGLILCAEIGPDMPFENIVALVEGFDKARRIV